MKVSRRDKQVDRELRLTDGSEVWVLYVGVFQNKRGIILARDYAGSLQPVHIFTADDVFASTAPRSAK